MGSVLIAYGAAQLNPQSLRPDSLSEWLAVGLGVVTVLLLIEAYSLQSRLDVLEGLDWRICVTTAEFRPLLNHGQGEATYNNVSATVELEVRNGTAEPFTITPPDLKLFYSKGSNRGHRLPFETTKIKWGGGDVSCMRFKDYELAPRTRATLWVQIQGTVPETVFEALGTHDLSAAVVVDAVGREPHTLHMPLIATDFREKHT